MANRMDGVWGTFEDETSDRFLVALRRYRVLLHVCDAFADCEHLHDG